MSAAEIMARIEREGGHICGEVEALSEECAYWIRRARGAEMAWYLTHLVGQHCIREDQDKISEQALKIDGLETELQDTRATLIVDRDAS